MNKTRQAPSARRIIGMVVGVIIIAFGPFIQFFDGLSYFTLIIVFTLFLKDYCGFNDADAPYWVGMYTLFLSMFVFAVGTICDIIRRSYS